MTQYYLAGEVSVRIGQLQALARDQAIACLLAGLRREAETEPLTALKQVVGRAVELTDRLCWDALERGDTATFTHEAAVCSDLSEFAVCAGLVAEGDFRSCWA
jgi:hypothetical protein